MHRSRVLRVLVTLASTTALAGFFVSMAATSPAGAVTPNAAACTFNGVAANGLVRNVSPGGTIAVKCSGLPASTSVVIAEASAIAGLLPSSDSADEADLGALKFVTTSSTGTLSYSYPLPNPWSDSNDTNAACPLTTAQVNDGLTGCAVAVAELSGTDFGDALLDYSSQPAPAAPSVKLTPTSAAPGETVTLSNGTGGYFWGDAFSNDPLSSSNITVDHVASGATTAVVHAAKASYNSKSKKSTVTPPAIGGSFTVPCVAAGPQTVSVNQPDKSLIAGTITASASLTITSGTDPAVTSIDPTRGPQAGGTPVTITGCNFTHVTAVNFGTKPAKSYHVNSADSITATAPPGTGTVNITVTSSGHTSLTGLGSEYTYGYNGYDMVGTDGGVYTFGDANYEGSVPGLHITPAAPIVGMALTGTGKGYWLAGADGGIFTFGDAAYDNSLPGMGIKPSAPIVGIASPNSGGYWLVGADGGVFSFGDAQYYGSLPASGIKPAAPIVGIASTPDGKGYWLVGADGGVYTFGDATFLGSVPGLHVRLSAAIVGMAPADAGGYWLVGADGGVFSFGNAAYEGSVPGLHVRLAAPISAIVAPTTSGYWIIGADGGVFTFGDATYFGSLPGLGIRPRAPVISATLA